MTSVPFCAAVDWGTSNFRIWLLDEQGRALAERSSGEGMRACVPDRFASVLESHLGALSAPADLPVVVAGMAGARGAWREVPYLETPANLSSLHAHAVRVEGLGRKVSILPGICQRARGCEDVMRGEETQLAGALKKGVADSALFCMPGTHSKWVWVEKARVMRFTTFMTGELFELVSTHSILREMVGGEGEVDPGSFSFREAVSEMLEGAELSGKLFSIRAAALLAGETAPDAKARLSGLCIGAELAAAVKEVGEDHIVLIASGAMADLYEAAISIAGLKSRIYDGAEVARCGLYHAARGLWSEREMP